MVVRLAIILGVAAILAFWSSGAQAAVSKASRPIGSDVSYVEFQADASQAIPGPIMRIKGVEGFTDGDSLAYNSMYLMCGATRVNMTHQEASFQTDETNNVTFPYINITEFDAVAVATLDLVNNEVWCELYLPEVNSGRLWRYPNGIRLDRKKPRTDGGKLRTLPIVPMSNGGSLWKFIVNDISGEFGGDPDGANGKSCPSCGPDGETCWQCNKSMTWNLVQSIRRQWPTPYASTGNIAGSVFPGDQDYILETIPSLNVDRFKSPPTTYCYVMRYIDTAGNASALMEELNNPSVTAFEKCVAPDSKPPQFLSVEYFTQYDEATGFLDKFPLDTFGNPVVTSNACRFSPSDCDLTQPRYIHLKITVNEPLFAPENQYGVPFVYNRYGAPVMAGDGDVWNVAAAPFVNRDVDALTDEEPCGFDNVDNDADGQIDEDVGWCAGVTRPPYNVNDRIDNDGNGYVDEIANGAAGKDSASYFCSPNYYYSFHQTYNTASPRCVPHPRIFITGPDPRARVPGVAHTDNKMTVVCTQDGITTHPECVGLPFGQTVFRYRWDVSGAPTLPGIEDEGVYAVTFTASDGVGNEVAAAAPAAGGSVSFDNSPPTLRARYYSNSSYSSTFALVDHDNDGGVTTQTMPIVPAGTVYFEVESTDDFFGATPSVYIFKPDSRVPAYMGKPQPNVWVQEQVHATCNQSPTCNYCTGSGCNAYDDSTNRCKTFRGCHAVAPATHNDGYAAITIEARDQMHNRKWHQHTYQAAADQYDSGKLSDDTYPPGLPDGIPNWVIAEFGTAEPDTAISSGQFFAIRMTPPGVPSASLPVAPCDGIIARSAMSCSPSAPTVNNPTLKWTMLLDRTDNDFDGRADEECYNGIDDDGDGTVDEDASVTQNYLGVPCAAGATAGWEISKWWLQVSTTSGFDDGTLVINNNSVNQVSINLPTLPQRTLAAPYYWRVAAFDKAGNLGPWNPLPMTATATPYFTFGIDTVAPQLSVAYFSDIDCTEPMPTLPDGTPVTSDTTSNPNQAVCLIITSNEPIPSSYEPSFETWQQGQKKAGPFTAIPWPPGSNTTFKADFQVDAIGAGQVYSDGLAYLYFTTRDLYGNILNNQPPASGDKFMVDSQPPQIQCAASPLLAGLDNNRNGVEGELEMIPDGDGVRVACSVSKYVGDSFRARVKQANFHSSPVLNDGLDNDCDGQIDEEYLNGINDDGDGDIDEDVGSFGAQPGSGCYVELEYQADSQYDYAGAYNIVSGAAYNGTASITVGDLDPNSPYFVRDLAGNIIYTTGSFTVDTVPPAAPAPIEPTHNQIVSDSTPNLRWRISPRASDMFKYKVQISQQSNFSSLIVDKDTQDDNYSTMFSMTVLPADILLPGRCANYSDQTSCVADTKCSWDGTASSCYAHELQDGKYYWRVYAYDKAYNRSASSVVYAFNVDTEPPGPPIFNGVTTPTTLTTSPLTGFTANPAEPSSRVNIYVNNIYIGTVYSNAAGQFTLGIDYDSDGAADEDPVNGSDDDFDGLVDEDPPGIFLAEGANIIEGLVIDAGGNSGARGCSPLTPFYNAGLGKCVIVRDSGPPQFQVTYFSDTNLTVPLPTVTPTSTKQAAKAGMVYMLISASEDLELSGNPNPPKFSVETQGSFGITNATTTSIGGSFTQFKGSFLASAESSPTYVDGDAKIVVIGTDKQGNTTPAGTIPSIGGYLAIDTKPPKFEITYWKDSGLSIKADQDINLLPITKAGNLYMRIRSYELLDEAPTINVDQQGTGDAVSEAVTAVSGSDVLYSYSYQAMTDNGSTHKDGIAYVAMNATDVAGNQATASAPLVGDRFVIDTKPPRAPSLALQDVETYFTQTTGSGSVLDQGGLPEVYATVEAFAALRISPLAAGDGIDNDGDGRIDEEPNGMDGTDNDRDGLIDEDYTSQSCGTLQIWSYANSVCVNIPDSKPIPDGKAITASNGAYSLYISGLKPGVNYVYARATDLAGNVSDFSPAAIIIGLQAVSVVMNHDFEPGWNLVGIPMQPSIYAPALALGVPDLQFFQLKNNSYIYNVGMDPAAPGMAYWVFFPTARTITARGVNSTTNQVPISEGWNIVGMPYDKSMTWSASIAVDYYGQVSSLGSSEAAECTDADIWLFDPADNEFDGPYGITDGATIEPWLGFAIKANRDGCVLVFPSMYIIEE